MSEAEQNKAMNDFLDGQTNAFQSAAFNKNPSPPDTSNYTNYTPYIPRKVEPKVSVK